LLAEIFAGHTSEDIVERLGGAGIPCGVVRNLGEALDLEIAGGSGSIADVEYPGEVGVIPAVRIPIKFEGEWCPVEPAPGLGQHNGMLDQYRSAKRRSSA
jgi:crotonobetainyl-CoA:carnitine CoA-transferase CaiB-like acyl-CoA transferase